MKYIIDPVHGFVSIPDGLILTLVKHPKFQRLTRVRQLGVEGMVYPGAQHTRFQHSIGAYYLTCRALDALESKGVNIPDDEREGLLAAILLHDVGHGPFSHVLEKVFTRNVSHEYISESVMHRINAETGGALEKAIGIFNGSYGRHFLHELVSSQLDMDRLDYLCRDSFFTGVREGNVGAARIIQMLDVRGDSLVVGEKGVYSVENYLMTRRMMYWQVYLHKTVVAAEVVLINALQRARELIRKGKELFASPALKFFLANDCDRKMFETDEKILDIFMELDDSDIISALKVWTNSSDGILASLSRNFINRRLFKVEVYDNEVPRERLESISSEIVGRLGIDKNDAHYFVNVRTVEKDMYSLHSDQIKILMRDGGIKTMPQVSEIIRSDTAAQTYRKAYLTYERAQ